MKNKERLDDILVSRQLFETKSKAQAAILAKKVKVNGESVTKSGTKFDLAEPLDIQVESMPYVSRGGYKLEKAINDFNINIKDKTCIDAGASTGGFTDCMLQNGAKKIYSIDVGYGQLAWKLRNHPQVVVLERTNIRHVGVNDVYSQQEKPELAEFCSIDLSFISLSKVLNNIKLLMNPELIEIVALVKPQFEAGKDVVPKSGVIKDKKIHINVIKNVVEYALSIGLKPVGITYSPVQGPAGNIEFLLYLKSFDEYNEESFNNLITKVVEDAHDNFSAS